jgi:hypothetical protein
MNFIRFAAFAASALLLVVAPAGAQISVQLGGSDGDVRAALAAQGYDRIDIVDRGLSSTTIQACRGPDRVELKVYWDGRVGTPGKIGGCRVMIAAQDARRILQSQGYDRIVLEDQQQGWVAIACSRGNRVRVNVSQFGDLSGERILGPCEPDRDPNDLIAELERLGFDRIEFASRQPPRYVALACLGAERYEIVFNKQGELVERRPIGQCEAPVGPYDLPAYLAKKGYDRAKVIDSRPPRYRVEACKGPDRVELVVGRYGRIVDEVRIGRCPPQVDRDQLALILRQQGYANISLTDNGEQGFAAIACMKDRRFELVISRYGEVLRERDLGRCSSLTVRELLGNLANEGWTGAGIYAEGCRKGRRVRIRLNEFGEETARENLGRC